MSVTDQLAAMPDDPTLLSFNRGIEREALRVSADGDLALTPHPAFLGSKLTHPKITTDFSESQLELITPVHQSAQAAIDDLESIHRFIYSGLNDEVLWSASMPCVLRSGSEIPLAYYGESNLGRLKTTYRNGLGYRYGRAMQTICAVHYNFSFSDSFLAWLKQHEGSTESDRDFANRRYFDLMRNLRRYSWLLTYLFGASPAVCNSFVRDREHSLQPFDEGTVFLPHATSLRSGNLGYQSDTQSEHMDVCYNSISSYVSSLATAICEPYRPYLDIGTLVDGEYRQVNANILQSEAEFYSSVRAKRVPGKGQNFLAALLDEGVQYIEVRLLDVNPYLPVGIDTQEINFLDTFLLFCLLADSPEHDSRLCSEVQENAIATVHNGRDPALLISDNGRERSLQDWGTELLEAMTPVAATLDRAGGDDYRQALQVQKNRLSDAELTPSGSVLKDMQAQNIPFFRFAMNQSLGHRDYFLSSPPTAAETREWQQMAADSVRAQADIEAADTISFDAYLKKIAEEYLPLAQG